MRDLLFKNLTSEDHGRKILSSSETVDKDGMRTTVHRHFVYFVRQIEKKPDVAEQPFLSVIKEHNSKQKYERFYCRMKGSMILLKEGKLLKIDFMHSLRIHLATLTEGLSYYPTETA